MLPGVFKRPRPVPRRVGVSPKRVILYLPFDIEGHLQHVCSETPACGNQIMGDQ